MRWAMSRVSAAMRCELLEPRDALGDVVVAVDTSSSRSPMQIATSLGSSAPLTGNSQLPCLVALADADRLVGGAVKLLADLHLDQRALLLDDDDEIETGGEFGEFAPAERPGAADLVKPDAELVAFDLVDAEFVEAPGGRRDSSCRW